MSHKNKAYFDPSETTRRVALSADPLHKDISVLDIYADADGSMFAVNMLESEKDFKRGRHAILMSRDIAKAELSMQLTAPAWKSLTDKTDALAMLTRDGAKKVAGDIVAELKATDPQAAIAMGVRVFDANGKPIKQHSAPARVLERPVVI